MSIWGYGRERLGVLGNLLNTHPMALKHLMPALMHFYIGVLLLPVDTPRCGLLNSPSNRGGTDWSELAVLRQIQCVDSICRMVVVNLVLTACSTDARRNIAYVLKIVWNNPAHRTALNEEAKSVLPFPLSPQVKN